MPKNLLIVESPAKAKTIEKYLGKDFIVKSSYGHIRDLDKGNKGVDVDNKFKPKYIVSPSKKKVVSELKSAVKKVDDVWLATDEDREGEAISWHLCKVLGLDEHSTKRIVFREITKPAITKAIGEPRKVDLNLVNAQQARRILDRLVGFELSEILWRKVKNKLSAGRVQSVAVKLLVEKEREIIGFNSTPYFRVIAFFNIQNERGQQVELKAQLTDRLDNEEEAMALLEACKSATFTIGDIQKKPIKRRPAPPFTTSTLQQEASRKLGFSVQRTMSVAQRLYEQGFITYMRTDSINLSKLAIGTIADEIKKEYGEKYLRTRVFKTKSAQAQEAHEAIRPTYIERESVANDRDQQRLYELIRKRTLASQMAEAQIEKTVVDIDISNVPERKFQATGEVLKFDGFLKVYIASTDEDEEEEASGMLPPLKVGEKLDVDRIEATERFTRPPARYTEASLVKKLEELGIGRPSTYAPTITKIMESDRGYVVKESREGVERKYRVLNLKGDQIESKMDSEITGSTSKRLYPTDMGMIVTDFLEENFPDIMNYKFTADIEQEFDHIAAGDREWEEMLHTFYGSFHPDVEDTIENAERATGERILGKDPETGWTVAVRMTRYGPVVQIGLKDEIPEEAKPKFANLRPGQSIETIEYDEAMRLFELPRTLGSYEGKDVEVNNGRYGPYVKFDGGFISLPKGRDPLEFTLKEAEGLIEEKRKQDAPVHSYKGKPVTRGKGRFGPFLKWNDLFVNIPKRFDPESLKIDEMESLIDAKIEKEANRFIQKWDDEQIAVENGRWGPFIRFKRKSVKLPKNADGKRMSKEEAADLTLEQVKAAISAEIPNAFKSKAKAKPKSKPKSKAK